MVSQGLSTSLNLLATLGHSAQVAFGLPCLRAHCLLRVMASTPSPVLQSVPGHLFCGITVTLGRTALDELDEVHFCPFSHLLSFSE